MGDLDFQEVVFNGTPLFLPSSTLKTMTHCTHSAEGDDRKHLYVETAHSDIMAGWLNEGNATFLDIGAATGAMTVPFALRFPDAKIYAFEPYHKVRQILIETLIKNKCVHPLVFDCALSANSGVDTFTAYEPDETGECPYLPEASSLSELKSDRAKNFFHVRVETLDHITKNISITDNCIVKIDVEGWEAKILKAGQRFISQFRPRFSIDIHTNPFGPGDTSDDVKSLLQNHSYSFEGIGHVMMCRPE